VKLDESAAGVFVIAVTPFTATGALDLAGTARLVEFYLAHGATGLTILGIMGEAPSLTAAEARAFVGAVLQAVGGAVPVVVGVSAPGLAPMGELAASAMDQGAAGVMVAPPSTLRTDAQITGYFTLVAETLGPGTPWVLQDYPQSNGVQMAPATIRRILESCPTCVMLKHEDWPGLAKISALREQEAQGARRVSILCGNGGLFLPEEMGRGADGAMTGFAFPEMMAGVVAAARAGDRARMHDLFDAYLPLCRYEQQPGIGLAVRKHNLARRGALASPTLRRPAPALSPADIAELAWLLARQEKRLAALG
jgi:4-hydroxy-tetrahydrodipicolinate synthase